MLYQRAQREYGLEFANGGVFLLVFIRFWHNGQLCRVFLKRTGRTQGQTQSELTLVARVMGAFQLSPTMSVLLGVRFNQSNNYTTAAT